MKLTPDDIARMKAAPEHQPDEAAKAQTLALLTRDRAADNFYVAPDATPHSIFCAGWDAAMEYRIDTETT